MDLGIGYLLFDFTVSMAMACSANFLYSSVEVVLGERTKDILALLLKLSFEVGH